MPNRIPLLSLLDRRVGKNCQKRMYMQGVVCDVQQRIMFVTFHFFGTMTNKCTIISQIITLLHVSTPSCYPQGGCNQYLAKLHKYFKCSCW